MLNEIKVLKMENEKIKSKNKYLASEVVLLKFKIVNTKQSNINKYMDITGKHHN